MSTADAFRQALAPIIDKPLLALAELVAFAGAMAALVFWLVVLSVTMSP